MSERIIHKRIGGIALHGISIAGEQTVIVAPELNVAFDIGKAPREVIPIDHVFLSHGHMDHAAGVAYYFSQRGFLGNTAGAVYVHPALVDPLRRLMAVWAEIEGHPSAHNIVPLGPGHDAPLRRNLHVRAFAVNHAGYSLGFSVIETRHKLREEFAGKTGAELVALKMQGIQIERQIEVPLVAYCGDSTEGEFLSLSHVNEAQVIILECTFVDPDHVHRARAGRHVHLRDLPRILSYLKNEHVVLAHLTRRTSLRDAKRAVYGLLRPSDRQRVTLFMDQERPRRGRNHCSGR